ncbi:MAG: polysaccharide deacetylase family protein [Acidobacteria bacterium]|nr:polysaccharide deacetylase family protein [Acidobacteriota bacterium]
MIPAVPVSRVLKMAAVHVLYYCGILGAWQRWALRRKAVVLMYHRVLTDDELHRSASHPAITVTSTTFERQMALLKKRFRVLSLEQFADHLERRVPFPSSAALVTFDDGWRDNYTNALPVLERYGLPAVVFVPSGYIGTRRVFWQEALVHLLLRAARLAREDSGSRSRLTMLLSRWCLDQMLDLPESQLKSGAVAAVGRLKPESKDVRQQLLHDLALELGAATDELADADGFIDWEQLHDMSKRGIAFGGHGVDHLLLTQASREEIDREVCGTREFLDHRLGTAVPTFSYPNGYLNPSIVERVRSAGYRLAFTTRRALIDCSDDPMMIGRVNIHEAVTGSNPMFLARLIGLF